MAANGTGNIASFTATNTGTTPITATITVTPTGNACPGTPQTFTIIVYPTVTMNDPADLTACNGSTVAPAAFTSTFAGVTYAWTNSNTAIGLAAAGTGNIASFTATNTGTTPITGDNYSNANRQCLSRHTTDLYDHCLPNGNDERPSGLDGM